MSMLWMQAVLWVFRFSYRRRGYLIPLIALLFMAENTLASVCSSITQPLSATTARQYLRSPKYPNQYPKGKTCVWEITAPSDSYAIKIEFLSFDLQWPLGNCSSKYDSLELRDGSSNSSSTIELFCENNKPQMRTGVYSSGRYLHLMFKSDFLQDIFDDKGFILRYSAVLKVTTCSSFHSEDQNANIMLGGSSGIIKSPNFPFSYPNSIKCIWRIKLSSNTDIVNISFTSFDLESSYSSSCSQYYDYLEIFDGYVINGVSLGRYCGTKSPPNIYTRKNVVTVVFYLDSTYKTGKGFSAVYNSVSSSGIRGSCIAPYVKNSLYVDNSAAVITSPNYPADYPNYMDCTWRITVSSGKRIKLYFLGTFKIDSICNYWLNKDFVEIRDGSSTNGKSLGTFCGITKPQPIVTSNNSALVQFQTDGITRSEGFYLVYEETSEKLVQYEGYCSPYVSLTQTFELTNISGTIMSPNYPSNYPQSIECIWKISVTDGKRVKFVVEDMDLEWSSSCYKDYVQVRNGYYSYSSVLKSCCGDSSCERSAIFSTDRYMWIKFRSDSSFDHSKGFKAKFSEIDKSASVGMIVGIVFGILALIAIVIVIAFCFYKSKRNSGAVNRSATVTTSTNITALQHQTTPQGTYPVQVPPQGGFPQGGYSQRGYLQGGIPHGGYPQGGIPQGGHLQGGISHGGYPQGGIPQVVYPQGGPQQPVMYSPAQKGNPSLQAVSQSNPSGYTALPQQGNYPPAQHATPSPPPYQVEATPIASPQ